MSQPGLPSLPPSSEKTAPLEVKDPTPETFWHSFTVFLSPFEKFSVQRWYILWLVFLGVALVTAFVTDLAVGTQYWHDAWFLFRDGNFQFSYLHALFSTSLIFILFVTGLFLTLGLANRWQRSIPLFFHTLERRCHLTDSQLGLEKSYQAYLTAYRRALLYGKGSVLIRHIVVGVVVLSSLIVLTVQFVSSDLSSLALLAHYGNAVVVLAQGLWVFEEDFFYPLLLMYLATSVIWIMGATGLYIRQFARHFPLRIQLSHPDNCGGFKFLGDFALNMALVILLAATLLAFWSMWRGYSIWSVGTSLLLLLLIIVSYGAFFAPVYAVHQNMLKERSVL